LEEIHGTLGHIAEVDLSPDLHYHMKVKFEEKEEILTFLQNQIEKGMH
jgi:hypothetical protein